MYKFILISALLLITHPIYAQNDSGDVQIQRDSIIGPGAYIKVTAPSKVLKWTAAWNPVPIKGIVRAIHSDTIVLEVDDLNAMMIIPIDAIKKLEIQAGKTSLKNVLLGGGFGLIGGTAIGYIYWSTENDTSDWGVLTRLYIGGGVGLIVGLVVGAVLPPDYHWKEIPLSRIKIDVTSQRDNGLRLEVSFTF